MTQNIHKRFLLLAGIIIFSTTHIVCADVSSIVGDTGTPQTGALTLSGGTSGASFDSTTPTLTQSFNFISLPYTTATNGQILVGGQPVFQKFPGGNANNFVGAASGNFGLSGSNNTGDGDETLTSLTSGSFNTAIGFGALNSLADGGSNIGIGYEAGVILVSGANNILIGNSAGSNYTSTENNNIILGNNPGITGESFTTRIGTGFTQTDCYIDGIYFSPIDNRTALDVLVDENNKIGTITLAVNIVTHITSPIAAATSNALLSLNPLAAVPKTNPLAKKRFTLVAAAVQKVLPDLITVDKHGNPVDVKIRDLTVLMLDQLQKQAARITALETKVQCLVNQLTPCNK